MAQHEFVQSMDGALRHLSQASGCPPEEQTRFISEAVQVLTHIRDHHTHHDDEDAGDFSTLFDYMIDRLSISHSGIAIDPINEVSWLLKNLRDLMAKPKHLGGPTQA